METTGQLDRGDGTRLAWAKFDGAGPSIVFLPGFRSDMAGDKATALAEYCACRGQAMLRFDYAGHGAAFLLLALPPAIGTGLLLWKRGVPYRTPVAREEAAQHRLKDLLRNPRLLPVFLFSGLLASGWDMYTFVIPIYGTRIGLSPSTIGIIMASFALATFVVRLAMPTLARRLSEWTVVCTALAIAGFAYVLFPLVTQVPFLMALSFLLGLGLGSAQPMIMAALYAASPPGRQGEVVGMRTTVINASQTFMPLAFGAVGTALGMAPILWTMAVALLAGSWLANGRRKKRT